MHHTKGLTSENNAYGVVANTWMNGKLLNAWNDIALLKTSIKATICFSFPFHYQTEKKCSVLSSLEVCEVSAGWVCLRLAGLSCVYDGMM